MNKEQGPFNTKQESAKHTFKGDLLIAERKEQLEEQEKGGCDLDGPLLSANAMQRSHRTLVVACLAKEILKGACSLQTDPLVLVFSERHLCIVGPRYYYWNAQFRKETEPNPEQIIGMLPVEYQSERFRNQLTLAIGSGTSTKVSVSGTS